MPAGFKITRPHFQITLLSEHDGASPLMLRWLKARLQKLAGLAGVREGELNVLIVGDAAMRRWHHEYMKQHSTTDVLSFDLRTRPDEPLCADLVVCLDVAKRQAQKRGHDPRLELLLYCLHGLLHMLGYDDHTAADHQRMHRREDELLMLARLPAVFAPQNSDPGPIASTSIKRAKKRRSSVKMHH